MTMKKWFFVIGILCLFSLTVSAEINRSDELRIIVQFHQSSLSTFLTKKDSNSLHSLKIKPSHISQVTRDEIIQDVNKRLSKKNITLQYSLKDLVLLRYTDIPPSSAPEILHELAMNPLVDYAEPDEIITGAYIPSDSMYNEQWALQRIGLEDVWEYTQGSASVIVAVLDTGVDYTHPDLFQNIIPGYDFCNDDDDPYDDAYDSYHGTHVAGIIAARGNNSIGMAGAAWNIKIMPLKVLNEKVSGYISDAVEAIDYAIAHDAFIINASWGFYETYYSSLRSAIARARDAGIIFVAAAGNGNSDYIGDNNDDVPYYPASFDNENILSVANTGDTLPEDELSSSSNYGINSVDLAAPGVSILSTIGQNRYQTKSGTSMAAPYVSGAAALIKSAYPELTFLEVMNAIMNNVDPLSTLTGKIKSGGRLNVFNALNSIPGSLPPYPPEAEDPPQPTPEPITDLFLEYMCSESGDTVSNALFKIKVVSRDTRVIELSTVTLRYYYTKEGNADINAVVDYCSREISSVVVTPGEEYVEIGFTAQTGTLADLEQLEIQMRLHYVDWSQMDQTNDYSFDPSHVSGYRKFEKITIYVNNSLVWGYGPEGPTPSPTPYSTPQTTAEPTTEPTAAATIVPTVEPTSAPSAEPTADPTPSILPGDVDSNGTVNIIDALLIAQVYVGFEVLNFNADAADVNCDNEIDIIDALLVAQYYVDLVPDLCYTP